ncbi:MAG: ATP-binding cassette domain-containing protein [Dehalococcoidales bacterium]
MDNNSILLQLKGISKVFSRGSIDEVTALNNLDLEVRAGDFITVIGSNGAGKTTLLNVIAGVYPPERGGSIVINNRDVTNLSEHRRAHYVGRVYQDPQIGTAANMTIEENLSLAMMRGQARGLSIATNKKHREQFRQALTPLGLGLDGRLTAPVGVLSGGQRQALALVMATLSNPSILMLDEHISTLDPNTARSVLEMTSMIIERESMTAMMVTHNMDIALRYGTRLIMMHKGRIIVDLDREKKKNLTFDNLITAFEQASGEMFADDNILLSRTESAD